MDNHEEAQYPIKSIAKFPTSYRGLLPFLMVCFLVCRLAMGCSGGSSGERENNLPDVDFDKILFVKRATYVSDHFYTDFINGCAPKHLDPNNGIYTFDLRTGEVTPVITSQHMPGGKGIFGRFSLSFDASKIVFDYKPSLEKGFRIWEVNLDGTGLRQLTFEPPDEAERIARYSMLSFDGWDDEDETSEGACCWPNESFCEILPVDVCWDEGGQAHPEESCQEACTGFEVEGEGWDWDANMFVVNTKSEYHPFLLVC